VVKLNNKKLVIESLFIKEALKKNLSLEEFLLLVYFDNAFDPVLNLEVIKKVLNLSEEAILVAYQSLLAKSIIKVEAIKNDSNKFTDQISLINFYNDVKLSKNNEIKKEEKSNIFSIFESELGRTLSPTDYELINAWLDKSGFSEDLIIAALKEAVYNGAMSLRYIDKVLYEWKRKGVTTVDQMQKGLENLETNLYETQVLEFDWLDGSR